MAPQKQHSNVVFLFKCIESSGVKIDFSKVGPALGLKPNAARMRYARLRKAIGGELQRKTLAASSRTRFITASKTGLVKKANTIKRIDVAAGGDSVTASGSETETSTEPIRGIFNPSSTRATQGNRIDYTKFDPGIEPAGESDLDNRESEYLSAPETEILREFKTPPRAVIGCTFTPPKSKQSIKQVSVSPQPLVKRGGGSNLASRTPPYSAKRKIPPLIRDVDREEAIRADLLDLATGQKIPTTTFKRRKLNVDDDDEARSRITDSISPNDSVSMVESEQYQKGKQKVVLEEPTQVIGNTFMQRLATFWK